MSLKIEDTHLSGWFRYNSAYRLGNELYNVDFLLALEFLEK